MSRLIGPNEGALWRLGLKGAAVAAIPMSVCALYGLGAPAVVLLALLLPIAIWHIAYAAIGLHKGVPNLEIYPDRLVVRKPYGRENILMRDGLVSFTVVPETLEGDAAIVAHGERNSFRELPWSSLRFDKVFPRELELRPDELEPILRAWLQGPSGPA